MEIVKIFRDSDSEYNIRIRNENNETLFKAKDILNVLEIKNITSAIKTIDDKHKHLLLDHTRGGIQSVIYLTEFGVYELIFNSRKEMAQKFKEWLFNIIVELRKTGKYIVEDKVKEENPNVFDIALTSDAKKEGRHYALVDSFRGKKIVYICEIKTMVNGKKLLKIGETSDIASRIQALKAEFGVPMFLVKAYEVLRNHDMEQFVLNHFSANKFDEEMPNGHKSKELLCLTDSFTFNTVDKYIQSIIDMFNKPQELSLENERLLVDKQILDQKEKEFDLRKKELELYEQYLKTLEKNSEQINSQIFEKLNERIRENCMENQETTSQPIENLFFVKEHKSRGAYIQKYSTDLKLIEHYESSISVCRKINGTSVSGLKTAIKNNTIYKGFRWWNCPKGEDPTIEKEIPETKEITTQRKDLIALLNLDKDEILHVFKDQKEFAAHYHLSHGAVCSAIKRGSRTQGGYVMFYHDVDEQLRIQYELFYDLPDKNEERKNVKKVQQLNPISKQVIKTFDCINDVLLAVQCSRKSLMEAIRNNEPLKNYHWSFAQ